MKIKYRGYVLTAAGLIVILLSSGCVGLSKSPTPRFYALPPMEASQAGETHKLPASIIIGIGPVKIPEYHNRPQIVTRDATNLVAFAQFDRWAEPLDTALARLTAANLSVLLPGATIVLSPWNLAIPVRYQVIIDVIQMDNRLDQDGSLAINWSIIDLENKKMILTKKSELNKPIAPHSYSGLVKTLSAEWALFSGEIANALMATTVPAGDRQ